MTERGQLDLLFGRTEGSLKEVLEERLGKTVSLVLTGNSTTMLSVRRLEGMLRVRLHRMFLNAGSSVIEEIASFLKNKRGAMPHFRNYVKQNREQLRTKQPRKTTERTAGRYFDLRFLFDEINLEYFGGTIRAGITWGSKSPRSAARKRTLGSYSERSNTIRINPVLDKRTVPRYYLSFVVYHEMLHAALGISKKGERRSVHPREFRKREQLFKDYARARSWERGSS